MAHGSRQAASGSSGFRTRDTSSEKARPNHSATKFLVYYLGCFLFIHPHHHIIYYFMGCVCVIFSKSLEIGLGLDFGLHGLFGSLFLQE